MSTGCIKPLISKETERAKIFLPAFLAPLIRGAGAAGDGGGVSLSLSLANAQHPFSEGAKRKSIYRSFNKGSQVSESLLVV